jgi:hypothetical protein
LTFETEVQKPQFQLNLIIEIDGDVYGSYQPDSGLTIDSGKVGLISKVRVNPTNVDIRNVNTTIASLNFDLLDVDGNISAAIMQNDTNYLEKPCVLKVGFITGSFDFADYQTFSSTRVKKIFKKENRYSFASQENTSLMVKPSFLTASTLSVGVTGATTEIDLVDGTNFPNSGRVNIEGEFITYTGKTDDQLTGITRGDLASDTEDHSTGSAVFLVTEKEDNVIDLLLDIMQNELGILPAEIDTASFTNIRNTYWPDFDQRFYLFNIQDTLKFFEAEILKSTNTRFIMENGLIGLAILDQPNLDVLPEEMNEDTIIGLPSYVIESTKIINEVVISWNYNDGQGEFSRTSLFEDADSKLLYPDKTPLLYEFKGIRADLDGAALVQQIGARILARLGTPRAAISANTFFSQSVKQIGDDVLFNHRYLPQQGAGLSMADQRLEIMSRALDFDRGIVKFKLEFTSFGGLRLGLIAPSPLIVSVTSQSIFEVPDGACYAVGYCIQIDGEQKTIIDVTGNIITVDSDFVVVLDTSKRVKFCDYEFQSTLQQNKYASVGFTGANFGDDKKSYQIVF